MKIRSALVLALKPPLITSESWRMVLMTSAGVVLLLVSGGAAWSFPTYDDCEACHGPFQSGTYTSLQDGTDWGSSLMFRHLSFVGGRCEACHTEGQGVFLNSSDDPNFSKSCVGCHGRDEDVTGNCTGQVDSLGGIEEECGSGAGLRQYHELKIGPDTCNGCHTADATPVGEHVAPFNYALDGSTVLDSCNDDGTESQFGPTGLDNDGDGQRDENDSDCSGIPPFTINAGLNDAWVNAEAANQGMFVTVFPSFDLMFAAWFTFDSVAPGGIATLGAPDQRWITALGPYSGTSATLNAELTTGGSFNTSSPTPSQDTNYGTIAMDFAHCNQVNVDYDFPGLSENGSMVMTRAVSSNVGLCDDIVAGNVVPTSLSVTEQAQQLSALIRGAKPEAQSAAFTINAGLNDSWANPDANFQGMFLTVFPDLQLMFAAWFTFDSQPSGNNATLGGPDQRWLTALGSYSGTTASLNVENTTGGLFNALDPTPTQDTGYGTLDIDFSDCNNATVTFDLPGAGESGQFNMSRVLNDNVGLCNALSVQ